MMIDDDMTMNGRRRMWVWVGESCCPIVWVCSVNPSSRVIARAKRHEINNLPHDDGRMTTALQRFPVSGLREGGTRPFGCTLSVVGFRAVGDDKGLRTFLIRSSRPRR